MSLCMVLTLLPPKKKVCRVRQTWRLAAILCGRVFLHMLPHSGGGEQGMEDSFFESVMKDRSKGPSSSRLRSLLNVPASLHRIGAHEINSWSMEVYAESFSPKRGSSSS